MLLFVSVCVREIESGWGRVRERHMSFWTNMPIKLRIIGIGRRLTMTNYRKSSCKPHIPQHVCLLAILHPYNLCAALIISRFLKKIIFKLKS